jgi:hypothetical protein
VIERVVPVPEPPKVSEPAVEPAMAEILVEEPAPEPVAAAMTNPSATGPADDLLDRVRQSLKESEKQLSALLNGSCELKSSEGETVVLGFFHTFHLERIERGGYKGKLEEAFSIALGRKVTVVYEHSPQERATGDKQRTGGHLVQAAREMGARAVPRQD